MVLSLENDENFLCVQITDCTWPEVTTRFLNALNIFGVPLPGETDELIQVWKDLEWDDDLVDKQLRLPF